MTTELIISKEWLKPKNPCANGYRWYLEKFPQGASFGVVYRALRGDARYSDADWLVDAAITGATTKERAALIIDATGANADAIAAEVATIAASSNVAATTGYRANAATTGYRANAATTGESAVSASLGYGAKAMAGTGGAIVLTHRDDDGKLLGIKASMVGENGIKPNVWYSLNEAGEFVEVV